jgi:NAD(P)-dependent dehydrogenase (short-subunit alcohol dehydrogenase family)
MESRYAATHIKPKGPGDARPTAIQIVKDEERIGDLKGKVVLITGCSSGLGIETARALRATGATLFLTARNLEKAKAALGDILDDAAKVTLLKLDLESLASVRACAAEFKAKSTTLNILINNAGVRLTPPGRTEDGFETQWGTNHVAHFLLFELLKQTLLDSSTPSFRSRVVAVSSTAHRTCPIDFDDLNMDKRGYDGVVAYGQSKLANVYMAAEIERRYGNLGLHAWSVHPGGIRTGLQRPNMYDAMVLLKSGPLTTLRSMQNTEQGASTTVWAAVSRELEGRGGKYLERCRVSEPAIPGHSLIDPGHAPFAYDEEAAGQLYDVSLKLVGLAA